jgi:hypothetical protein
LSQQQERLTNDAEGCVTRISLALGGSAATTAVKS